LTRLPRGIDLVVRPERAEALLWMRLRLEERPEAREPLFNRYASFARSVALRVRPWGQAPASRDAEQWAYAGLLQAIDSFDPLRGSRFESFAKPRIAGSVRDGFAQSSELEAQWSYRRKQEREYDQGPVSAEIAKEKAHVRNISRWEGNYSPDVVWQRWARRAPGPACGRDWNEA